MRIRIAHRTVYRYDPPAAGVIQVLRLTPRNHEGQYVVRWRIDVSADARLAAHEDAFGNITHVFSADGPFDELRVEVDGEVETQNTNGVVRGTVERFRPSLFLRDTALTQADARDPGFCAKAFAPRSGGEVLGELHGCSTGLFEDMAHDADEAPDAANAAEAFARKRGSRRDLSPHLHRRRAHASASRPVMSAAIIAATTAAPTQAAGHAWAEAFVPDLGWVGFDPANGLCPTDAHVRVAIGLDSLGAAPVRGMRYGAGAETLAVAIRSISEASRASPPPHCRARRML